MKSSRLSVTKSIIRLVNSLADREISSVHRLGVVSIHRPSLSPKTKARDLITDITGKQPDESLSGSSLDALIDNAEDALMDRYAQDQVELEEEKEKIVERRNNLKAFLDIQKEIEEQQSLIQNVQSQLDAVLEDMSLTELQDSVKKTQEAADTADLRYRIVKSTVELLHRDRAESVSCPVCKEVHRRQDLKLALQHTVSQPSDDVISRLDLDQLESRLRQAEKLECEAQGLRNKLAKMGQKANAIRTDIDSDDAQELSEPVNLDLLDAMINRYSEREASIEAQIDKQEDWFDAIRLRLSNLKEEEKFHQIKNQLSRSQQSRNRFTEVERAYQDLVSFGESVRTIQQEVKTCLNKRLKKDIPEVSENLSQVFAALTYHPWFDRLIIARNTLPKLELQVASSQDRSGTEHPTGVLNGQAESALDLVPYFAFSQADNAPTEVYLVLLDDPTRAFDEEHTNASWRKLLPISLIAM